MLLTQEIKDSIINFNLKTSSHTYIYNIGGIFILLSKSFRYLDESFLSCFNIVSINLDKPLRNRGFFKEFIKFVTSNINRVIYIERVTQPFLCNYLERNNWNRVPSYQYFYTSTNSTKDPRSLHFIFDYYKKDSIYDLYMDLK